MKAQLQFFIDQVILQLEAQDFSANHKAYECKTKAIAKSLSTPQLKTAPIHDV